MSAYFHDNDDSSMDPSQIAVDSYIQSATHGRLVEFPDVTKVLWEGQATNQPFYLQPLECLPKLFLNYHDIQELLGYLLSEQDDMDFKMDVFHSSLVKHSSDGDSDCYFLSIRETKRYTDNCVLTVPIVKGDVGSSDCFDQKSSIDLINNLAKSLFQTRDLNLKSFIKIRAVGMANAGFNQYNRDNVHGIVRFQAICPNVTFQVTPIRQLTLYKTPLLSELVTNTSSDLKPTMGFLSLNSMRHLVVMKETDPAVPNVPTIGIWVRFGNESAKTMDVEGMENLCRHPYTWGACMHYLCSTVITDRRFEKGETFVVVIVVPNYGIAFFEACRMVDTVQGVQQSIEEVQVLSRKEDYLFAESVIDLSTHSKNTGEEYVISPFRRTVMGPREKQQTKPVVASQSPNPSSINTRSNQNLSSEYETETPAPCNRVPIPYPVQSPSKSSINELRHSVTSISSNSRNEIVRQSHSRINDDVSKGSITSLRSLDTRDEFIMSQQRQIDHLTKEVERLASLIESNITNTRSPVSPERQMTDRAVDPPSSFTAVRRSVSSIKEVKVPIVDLPTVVDIASAPVKRIKKPVKKSPPSIAEEFRIERPNTFGSVKSVTSSITVDEDKSSLISSPPNVVIRGEDLSLSTEEESYIPLNKLASKNSRNNNSAIQGKTTKFEESASIMAIQQRYLK